VWAAPVGSFFTACAKLHVLGCKNNNARLNRALCGVCSETLDHLKVDLKVFTAAPN
jgi:hypothetical protein